VKTLSIVFALLFANCGFAQDSPRRVISLDGEWRIAEGTMTDQPTSFPSVVSVPGLVDMASPAFEDVGLESPKRQAFWYKREFEVDGTIPAVAELKLYKAAYGNQAFLNGKDLGESWASFTPVLRDVRSALKPGRNTLVVKVAAHATQVPSGYPHGLDPEKTKYIPGIFDSVELILTGTPTVANIQTVPEIDKQKVHVHALLKNDSGETTTTRVAFTVREHKSGKVAGSGEAQVELPAADSETTATAVIDIKDCRLWSPEDPFLYDVVVDTGADRVTERFGMREFRLDQETGFAFLNGKQYFLRGSNITLYRFFEDSARKGLPWDKEWVRGLHKLVRDMHWNSLRYCIGFPPDFWYDIADEEGILLQDEFPIWNARHQKIRNDLEVSKLVAQYSDWMRDRWNHPSVVIWDAQNETHSVVTGETIAAVRGLDLSNRPWDNGYGRYRPTGDSFESHPYLFNKRGFHFSGLADTPVIPTGNAGGANTNKNPIILNEYGWLWVTRDGQPTTLSRHVYARLLKGKEIGPSKLRLLYARLLAGLTEFWRSHRTCAGVLHFCILGYSRDDGQTSDHFINVEKLELEPEFRRFVRDAFAPVGLMIDYFDERTTPGKSVKIPVAIINDLDKAVEGKVEFSMVRQEKVIYEAERDYTVSAFGRAEIEFPLELPEEEGDYLLKATISGADNKPVSSWRNVSVGLKPEDLPTSAGFAIGKPVTASSSGDEKQFPASNAVDGKLDTRWASEHSSPQWIMVDLEKPTEVTGLEVVWENAFAKSFFVETSVDGKDWNQVFSTKSGYGEEPPISFAPHQARYVRLTGTVAGSRWGFSIWELKIW